MLERCILEIEGAGKLDVIERLKNKDETALEWLMKQYGDYLLRLAYMLLKDQYTAEEVVQDTFITAYRKISTLRQSDQLRSWLTRITINGCRMQQRKWSWRKIISVASFEDAEYEEHAPDTEEIWHNEWQNKQISASIMELDYKYREVILLYYYSELTIKEIVSLTKLNENTIKARLARGRKALRQLWVKEDTAYGSTEG